MFTSFSPLLRLSNSHFSIDVFFLGGGGETLGFPFRFRGGQFSGLPWGQMVPTSKYLSAPGFNWHPVEGAGSYN